MKVSLVSYSQPSEELKHEFQISPNVQDLVAYCARVSNPTNQTNRETSHKLLQYLIKHQHWSPFEMVSACLKIVTTRDIARQILRHRSFSFQEFSQRYADPTQEFSFVPRQTRLQDLTNRQNSVVSYDEELQREWYKKQEEVVVQAQSAYRWAIDHGIAKEQARVVLPEGLTESVLYVSGTIRSWIHYIQVRGAHGTQLEHVEIARTCAQAISSIFPSVYILTQ